MQDDDVVFQRSWIARHGTDASQIGKPVLLSSYAMHSWPWFVSFQLIEHATSLSMLRKRLSTCIQYQGTVKIY